MDPYALLDRPRRRPVPRSISERLQFRIGRWIDESSLFYESWRVGRADPERLRRRSERYRRAIDHLDRLGAIEQPTRLFEERIEAPSVERRPRQLFGLPPCDSIRFASAPRQIFPESFDTAPRSDGERSRFARGTLWRRGGKPRPAIVCIHGYRGGFPAFDARGFGVGRLLVEHGFDVALVTLPYHGARTPAGTSSGQLFLNDPLRTIEAVVQATTELRRTAAWLRSLGAPSVGVMGMSLGGYLAALLASVEPRLDFAVSVIPVASFADILWERAGRRGEHGDAKAAGIDLPLLRRLFSPHCPLHHDPLVRPSRRLVIAGAADRIVPPEHPAALAAHWKTPVEWFPGGHLAQLGRGNALRRLASLRDG